jgi:hypothetical protein
MLQSEIYRLVTAERAYQDNKWGNTDGQNDPYNWGAYIAAYTSRSLIGFPGDTEARREAFKKDMVKVAALAVAALEKL